MDIQKTTADHIHQINHQVTQLKLGTLPININLVALFAELAKALTDLATEVDDLRVQVETLTGRVGGLDEN
jgi:hypothetical protein